jgi:2-iminoacetate synthase
MSFRQELETYPAADLQAAMNGVRPADVRHALETSSRSSFQDFIALISPAATPFLEAMAAKSQALTRRRFGRTIQLYAPVYLSSYCVNSCTYCGFSRENKIPRRALTLAEMEAEIRVVGGMGFEHVLLVTGEGGPKHGIDYLLDALKLFQKHFTQVSMEVQPLDEEDYQRLAAAGLHAVMVYQETYNRETYSTVHAAGPKRDYDYRLETPDRLGKSGLHKVGVGVLLGLADWRIEACHLALHLRYLEKHYWRMRTSLSFPRLRPNVGGHPLHSVVSDRDLLQMICAFRLFDEELEISISTRESASFRDHVAGLGATVMSAGSKTDPGGYASEEDQLEQFEISDDRSPAAVAEALRQRQLDPVWKDWDGAYSTSNNRSQQRD